ncbi:MAG: helix-turn-helix transcriptional regulator [Treponema sp.]|nr:helix-turn-helix transcriptional regulator [Treponema sp.]
MGFKENLKIELDYKGMIVKELAYLSGVNKRTIDQYLSSAAKMPSAENAVKIASALGVTVEYLITGKNKQLAVPTADQQNQIRLYKKYFELINLAEKLNEQQLKSIENLMKTM